MGLRMLDRSRLCETGRDIRQSRAGQNLYQGERASDVDAYAYQIKTAPPDGDAYACAAAADRYARAATHGYAYAQAAPNCHEYAKTAAPNCHKYAKAAAPNCHKYAKAAAPNCHEYAKTASDAASHRHAVQHLRYLPMAKPLRRASLMGIGRSSGVTV